MNHRATKKVTVSGSFTLHHPPPQTLSAMARRACLPSQSGNTAEAGDLTRTAHPCLWLINRTNYATDYLGRNLSYNFPIPDEEIFLYPVVIIGTNTNGHYIGETEVKDFYSVVIQINERKKDCKQCYLVQVLMRKAASAHHVMQPGCDIIYIIGHGTHIKGEDYIELADGLFRISRIQKPCFPIGCYVGENRGRPTSQVGAIKLLTDKLRKYITIPDCSGKITCVFSGPLYPRRNS